MTPSRLLQLPSPASVFWVKLCPCGSQRETWHPVLWDQECACVPGAPSGPSLNMGLFYLTLVLRVTLGSLTEVVTYRVSSNPFCQDTSTERDHTCVMSIQLFWNVMLFCCAFIFPCKSNCCKLIFFFLLLVFSVWKNTFHCPAVISGYSLWSRYFKNQLPQTSC